MCIGTKHSDCWFAKRQRQAKAYLMLVKSCMLAAMTALQYCQHNHGNIRKHILMPNAEA